MKISKREVILILLEIETSEGPIDYGDLRDRFCDGDQGYDAFDYHIRVMISGGLLIYNDQRTELMTWSHKPDLRSHLERPPILRTVSKSLSANSLLVCNKESNQTKRRRLMNQLERDVHLLMGRIDFLSTALCDAIKSSSKRDLIINAIESHDLDPPQSVHHKKGWNIEKKRVMARLE